LKTHTHGDDLGLRLRGEQLAAGVRFVRMIREGTYDVSSWKSTVSRDHEDGRFYLRAQNVCEGQSRPLCSISPAGTPVRRSGGASALLTMRNWMFIKQYSDLRQWLLKNFDLRLIGDLSSGAFEEISAAQVVVSVVMTVFWRRDPLKAVSLAMKSFDGDTVLQIGETKRKRASLLIQVGRTSFSPNRLRVVEAWPLVYWWTLEFVDRYDGAPKLDATSPARQGLATGNDRRFFRLPSELRATDIGRSGACRAIQWAPLVKGAAGTEWIEPLTSAILWRNNAIELQVWLESYRERSPGQYFKNSHLYFRPGVAFSTIGHQFSARAHRFPSVFGEKGASIFSSSQADTVCLLNSSIARRVLQDLNPGLDFKAGDVNRMPKFAIDGADAIFEALERAFDTHESHREPSVEFRHPGPLAVAP
jgi:hypothetical protein